MDKESGNEDLDSFDKSMLHFEPLSSTRIPSSSKETNPVQAYPEKLSSIKVEAGLTPLFGKPLPSDLGKTYIRTNKLLLIHW